EGGEPSVGLVGGKGSTPFQVGVTHTLENNGFRWVHACCIDALDLNLKPKVPVDQFPTSTR
ncbi:MAG: hypothetical protein ACJATT_003731, partial [Myxococcota bacterium]